VYHVDLQFSVDQRVYWCRSTPSKLPDEVNFTLIFFHMEYVRLLYVN